MLKEPRIGGAAQLRLFVHELGFERACKAIDVAPTTMRRWLREATPVPMAALAALYWLTSYGFSEACAEVHWSHQFLLSKVRTLEARLYWQAPSDWEAVNEPDYHAPGLVVPIASA
jgi:hypothetical protein